MTLEKYTRADLLLLPPTATIQDGAVALARGGIGMVLVHDGVSLVGLVTDRDIAVRAAAAGLDPASARLSDVMSRDVATLPTSASEGEAGRLMLERRVRRVPLLEGSTPVGVVTFDDLVLNQEVSPSMLSAILRAQLLGPGKAERNGRTLFQARSGAPAMA